MPKPKPLAGDAVAKIRAKLGHLTLEAKPACWLDTGFRDLNEVLGDPELGIPYGRMIELSGLESHGKTGIALTLAALAQRDGATVLWGDFENSFEKKWASQRGLDCEALHLFQPYVGIFEKNTKPRLSTAEDLCAEMEADMDQVHRAGRNKMISVVDSIPALLTEGEATAGIGGQNLRTSMDLPMFLGKLMRRWVGLAQSYGVMMLWINQLRQNPMARFGDPWYTPGGNAIRFYYHVRGRVRRVKGGRILQKGKLAGIQGVIRADKNKVGGRERAEVGYRLMFDGPMEFVPAAALKKDTGEDE